jgi:hypothetical protein
MDMGEDNNLMVLTEQAKDAIDFYQTMESIDKKVQQEELKLWAKFSPLVSKMEQKYGKVRPDLSYNKK